MKHKHHIDPKHSGGDPNGLTVELTIEEHAEEHRLLWIKEGREYDRIAWLALSKQIGKEEAFLLALKSPERRKKISEKLKGRDAHWMKGNQNGKILKGRKRPEHSALLKEKYKTGELVAPFKGKSCPNGFKKGNTLWTQRKHTRNQHTGPHNDNS